VRHANFRRDAEAPIARMHEDLSLEGAPERVPKLFKRRWVRVMSAAVVLVGVAGSYALWMSGPDEASQSHEIEQKVVDTPKRFNLLGLELSDITRHRVDKEVSRRVTVGTDFGAKRLINHWST
jgi:hypothetical protein